MLQGMPLRGIIEACRSSKLASDAAASRVGLAHRPIKRFSQGDLGPCALWPELKWIFH